MLAPLALAAKSGKPWLTAHLPALLGFGLTVCSLLLVGSDKFLLLSMGFTLPYFMELIRL